MEKNTVFYSDAFLSLISGNTFQETKKKKLTSDAGALETINHNKEVMKLRNRNSELLEPIVIFLYDF